MPATAADVARLGPWAAMLNPDANIDRTHCSRIVPLEVMNLSAPRTGTLSMRQAFEILGYKEPYHFASLFENARDADMWNVAFDTKFRPNTAGRGKKPLSKKEWDQLIGHSGAVGDVPCALFWRELLELYPEAKVILVERDRAKWLKSMRQVVGGIVTPIGRLMCITEPGRTGRILGTGYNWIDCFFGLEGNITLERAMARADRAYEEHYSAIRATVPKDKLLEYKLGSGWRPLCEFLGKEVPDVPFPHQNDAATVDAAIGTFYEEAIKKSLRNIGVLVALGAVLVGSSWKLYDMLLLR